jgi:hypothetical protein
MGEQDIARLSMTLRINSNSETVIAGKGPRMRGSQWLAVDAYVSELHLTLEPQLIALLLRPGSGLEAKRVTSKAAAGAAPKKGAASAARPARAAPKADDEPRTPIAGHAFLAAVQKAKQQAASRPISSPRVRESKRLPAAAKSAAGSPGSKPEPPPPEPRQAGGARAGGKLVPGTRSRQAPAAASSSTSPTSRAGRADAGAGAGAASAAASRAGRPAATPTRPKRDQFS